MAQRTTISAVRAILQGGRDYDAAQQDETLLQPYIDTATLMVDRVEACAVAKGRPLTEAELERVEAWVSAWSYKNSDQQAASKSNLSASQSFKGQTGMYLESNHYGQQALALDPSGCLAALAMGPKRPRAGLFWGGQPASEQTPHSERN